MWLKAFMPRQRFPPHLQPQPPFRLPSLHRRPLGFRKPDRFHTVSRPKKSSPWSGSFLNLELKRSAPIDQRALAHMQLRGDAGKTVSLHSEFDELLLGLFIMHTFLSVSRASRLSSAKACSSWPLPAADPRSSPLTRTQDLRLSVTLLARVSRLTKEPVRDLRLRHEPS